MIARVSADFLIVGSGVAGLRAAVTLAARGRVLMLTKSDPGAGNTGYAQGGIAAAVGPDDSPALHAADTLAAGAGLCDARAVETLVEDGPAAVHELMAWGAEFDRAPDGTLDLAREAAHSVRRVLHARDATGREIGRALAARLTHFAGITVVDHARVIQALVEDGRVSGVRYLDAGGQVTEARARATLIATGGAGQVYRETTNPAVATGDGVMVAYLAGAGVGDLEFVQFHPTALTVDGHPRYLLSEALRGEGARLLNADGERFMVREEAAAELAPRDRVARAIVREAKRTKSPVYLSLAHLPAATVRARFPLIAALCAKAGLDLATDRLPVSPAAHYFMGGVLTDLDGRTTVPGLFAAGEVACTGVHGANRLASNSLLEGLVFGARAGRAMLAWNGHAWPAHERGGGGGVRTSASAPMALPLPVGTPMTLSLTASDVRDVMWNEVGVFRDAAGLSRALVILEGAWTAIEASLERGGSFDADGWHLASLVAVGRLVARAALRREESLGAHWRTDFPEAVGIHSRTQEFRLV